MAKTPPNSAGKPVSDTEKKKKKSGTEKTPGKGASKPEAARPARKFDIVEEAGKESFPASDPPSWNP